MAFLIYSIRKNVSYYYEENLRSAKSFMHLLINCEKTYDYYAFCDQDDVWDKDKLISAIRVLQGISCPALYCGNAELVDSNLHSLHETVYKTEIPISFARVLIAGEVQGATMVMNGFLAEVFNSIEIPDYIPMHDYYVAAVCGALGGQYFFDFKSHMLYRQHESNVLGVSVSLIDKIRRNVFRVFKKNTFNDLELFSKQLLKDFGEEMPNDKKQFVRLASEYKCNLRNKIRLAFYNNLEFGKINQEIEYRLAILLGKI